MYIATHMCNCFVFLWRPQFFHTQFFAKFILTKINFVLHMQAQNANHKPPIILV